METELNEERQGRPMSRPSDFNGGVKAVVNVVLAVADCIRELRTVPSGHLYARLMGHLDIDHYQGVIATLVRTGLIREHPSHLLEWIGPSGPTAKPNQQQKGTMKIEIPSNTTAKKILATNKPPRGTTHFRFSDGTRKPVIDKIANIDCLAGCTGTLEYGKATFEGRGRHAKIKEFIPAESEQASPPPPAPTAPEPSEKPASASNQRKNKIHGFSACAVAKSLGKAGLKWEEADRIFRAHGIEMPKASLSVQLGFGRNQATWEKRGEPAPLTEEQIADLRKEVAA